MTQNPQCDICEMIKNKSSFKLIYENEQIIAMLHEAPAFIGHTIIMPKEHYRIIEEVPDKMVSQLYTLSNKISTALFESLNIHGTNILINNGPDAGQTHAHFIVNVIPRVENDKINLEWAMQKSDPQKLDSTYKFLKDYVEKAILGDTGETKQVNHEEKTIITNQDDYRIKQLKRMP